MVSFNTTNYGSSLAALRRVNNEINQTQNRIATGYKVSSAKDNASVWATATKLRGDITTNESVKGGLATAKAQADAGLAVLDEISTLVDEVAKILNAAGGAATASQVTAVGGYAAQITNLIGAASYGGKNTLAGDTITAKLPYSDGTSAGNFSYTSTNISTATGAIKDLLAANDATKVNALSASALFEQVAGATAALGAVSKAADGALNFADKLADIQSSALGALVDADMEREAAKMQALQVRQQLAYQAMSMTSNTAQNILMLFR